VAAVKQQAQLAGSPDCHKHHADCCNNSLPQSAEPAATFCDLPHEHMELWPSISAELQLAFEFLWHVARWLTTVYSVTVADSESDAVPQVCCCQQPVNSVCWQ